MPVRCVLIDAELLAGGPRGAPVPTLGGSPPRVSFASLEVAGDATLGLVHVGSPSADVDRAAATGPTAPGLAVPGSGAAATGGSFGSAGVAFELPLAAMGLDAAAPVVVEVAAAAARCFARDVVVAAGPGSPLLGAAEAAGARTVVADGPDPLVGLGAALADLDAAEAAARAEVGVGPHPQPWPDDPRLDPALLAHGDRRNVVDRYRYWSEAAIVADLDRARLPLHVAVENWQHDLNIGTVVRNANAFNVAGVHIVGRRRWNRRGAMATDRYLHVSHHDTVEDFATWAAGQGLAVVGIDNVAGSVPLRAAELPRRAVLVFGQEGPGLSPAARAACALVCEIPQAGSTRSLNAGVASGIAMYEWVGRHGAPSEVSGPAAGR